MKKNTGKDVRLGVFVSIGILLFIGGLYFVGKKQGMFSKTFAVSAVFKDVSGLREGNNVRFSGINLGIIQSVDIITDTTVRVVMSLDENARRFIKIDARASIGSEGLMGNKIVSISPGTPSKKEIQHNGVLATNQPIDMDDILLKLSLTADNASTITGDMAEIMRNIREGKGTIGRLFMDSVYADNIDQTLVNLKQGTGGFKQNMEAAQESFLLKSFFKKKKKEAKKNDSKK